MTDQTAEALIDALNSTFGRHKGYRASHAKGVEVRGRFLPNPATADIDIPMLRDEQPVSARFSIGGGKPGISDKSPTVRGIGLRIGAGDEAWALALISAPVFFANSAEQFKAFLAARRPDPTLGGPNPDRVKAFNTANPNTMPHQQYLTATPPCRCYTAERYHSGHAYRFDVGGDVIGRVVLEPEQGRQGLSADEMDTLPDDFLEGTLQTSLARQPARWSLKIIVSNDADQTDDPTVPWEGEHQEITLGTLELSEISEAAPHQVFDPSVMPTGVQAPEDAIFGLRSAAYAVSYERRQS